ncbi:alpha/beta fold hydrolase [Metabacillus sp. SLBN-84]
MKRWIKNFFLIAVAALVLAFAGFYIWSQQTYKPSDDLYNSTNVQKKNNADGYLLFEPVNQKTKTGIIFYPGAKVEPEAYAYLAEQLAQRGYTAAIVKMPFNLAITGINKASNVIKDHPEITKWYLGGHSLGGASASIYAYDNQDTVKGLFLMAAYPTDSSDFSGTDFPILTIYADRDGLATLEDIREKKHLLSDDTFFYRIKGGNHAQFGIYGNQKGDNEADINVYIQQDLIVSKIDRWILMNQ